MNLQKAAYSKLNVLYLFEYRKETGEKAYPMTYGGSTSVGIFGYVNAFDEMEKQVSSDLL